jgi:hypothetical protein
MDFSAFSTITSIATARSSIKGGASSCSSPGAGCSTENNADAAILELTANLKPTPSIPYRSYRDVLESVRQFEIAAVSIPVRRAAISLRIDSRVAFFRLLSLPQKLQQRADSP